jgi:ribosomal protein S18 acetylase RimI-like enzyme
MPDRDRLRTLLQSDPVWSVYALGDLAPGLFEQADWRSGDGERPAVLMLFRGFGTPVLFALGELPGIARLFDTLPPTDRMYLHVRPEVLTLLQSRGYAIREAQPMWRMTLREGDYRPAPADGTRRLTADDLPALERLYADGSSTGESPHFFLPSMVTEGAFFGIFDGPDLLSAAGTHLLVPAEGVAAVGNVYTLRNHRNRGLAAQTTSAVVNELLRQRIPVIILNVGQANAPAVRVYERLGFTRHCGYIEGLAVRPS